MTSASAKKRKGPSGPPFTEDGITNVLNVGDGTGLIFRDIDPVDTANLRTLVGLGGITISTLADTITIDGNGSGSQGPQGFQGAQGPQGSQGSQGPQGAQGAQGAQGSQGFQGAQGPQGAQGSQGPQGEDGTGTQGPQGFQGAQGAQGSQGAQGTQGTQGNSGASYYEWPADALDSPTTSDWAVNANAPVVADPANTAIIVRQFEDTAEIGCGGRFWIPAGSTNLVIKFNTKAQTAPAGTRTVGLKLYVRELPDNAAVTSWSAGTQLTDLSYPTNSNYQYDTETISLASLGLTAGNRGEFELTRVNPTGGTELTGNMLLESLTFTFT